jgi:hypothetical protein
MPNGAFHSGASDEPTTNHDERYTLASHAITVARGCRRNRNRLPVPPAAICPSASLPHRHLRRAKFEIGVRSSKDGKSGAWWWTLPPPED